VESSTSSAPWIVRGLNLSELDSTSPEELEGFRETERTTHGFLLPSYDLLVAGGRADVVKRWFTQMIHFFNTEESTNVGGLLHLHLYAITGYIEGAVYEITNGRQSRAANMEIFALAFLHSPSGGLSEVAHAVEKYLLHEYEEPEAPFIWPEGWAPDPDFFKAGLNFSAPEMLPGELEMIEEWYERVTGEVPRYVRFLGQFRPHLLKGYRNRFENTIRVLPKQIMPFILLHYECYRGHEEGIRDAVLLAKGFGLTRTQTVDPIVRAMLYGAHGAVSNADRAAGDLLRNW